MDEGEAPGDDRAGPIMGWSLGSGLARRPLDELLSFPCQFAFKAVGKDGAGFVDGMLRRVADVIGRSVEEHEISSRQSARGRYKSVTLDLWVESGEQIYSIYEAMYDDERVRYVL